MVTSLNTLLVDNLYLHTYLDKLPNKSLPSIKCSNVQK